MEGAEGMEAVNEYTDECDAGIAGGCGACEKCDPAWWLDIANQTIERLDGDIARLTKERNDARANARILAHSYEHDCRPLARAVKESLAYPVRPEPVTLIPSRTHDADFTQTVLADNEHDDYDWVDLDWVDGPVRSIAMVPRDDLGRDIDLLEVRTLGWQDKHEYQHVRFEREDLQAILDYIDGKEVRDFQDEPKVRGK